MKYPFIAAILLLPITACRQGAPHSVEQRKALVQAQASSPSPTDPVAAAGADSGVAAPDFRALNAVMRELQDEPAIYIVPGSKPYVIRGEKGIRVRIVPADLETTDGKAVAGRIQVSLLEMTSKADFIRNNAPTMANGQALISGGSVDIQCTAGGRELRLKAGKTMEIAFPASKNGPAMGAFYGRRSPEGNLNWLPDDKSKTLSDGPVDSVWVERLTIHYADSVVAELHAKSSIKNAGTAMRIRIDTVTDKVYLLATNYNRPLDTTREMVRVPKTRVLNETLYNVLQISRLGLANCDRYSMSQLASVIVKAPRDAEKLSVMTLIVYQDDNTVMQYPMFFVGDNSKAPVTVPWNRGCRMLSFAYSNNQLYGYATEFVGGKMPVVTPQLQPITKADMERMIAGKS